MTVIKLGRNTYRVYTSSYNAAGAASFLFLVKPDQSIVLKRSDVPKEMHQTVIDYLISSAEFAMKAHIDTTNDLVKQQGFIMGLLSA